MGDGPGSSIQPPGSAQFQRRGSYTSLKHATELELVATLDDSKGTKPMERLVGPLGPLGPAGEVGELRSSGFSSPTDLLVYQVTITVNLLLVSMIPYKKLVRIGFLSVLVYKSVNRPFTLMRSNPLLGYHPVSSVRH